MNSGGSVILVSAGRDPGWGTEIDVFETLRQVPEHDRRYYMTLHVTRNAAGETPLERRQATGSPVAVR